MFLLLSAADSESLQPATAVTAASLDVKTNKMAAALVYKVDRHLILVMLLNDVFGERSLSL